MMFCYMCDRDTLMIDAGGVFRDRQTDRYTVLKFLTQVQAGIKVSAYSVIKLSSAFQLRSNYLTALCTLAFQSPANRLIAEDFLNLSYLLSLYVLSVQCASNHNISPPPPHSNRCQGLIYECLIGDAVYPSETCAFCSVCVFNFSYIFGISRT